MTATSFEQGVNNAVAIIKALKLTMKGNVNPTAGHFENFITDGTFDIAVTIERLWRVVGKTVKVEEIGINVTDGCLLIPRSSGRAFRLCKDGTSSIINYSWDTPAYLSVPLSNKIQGGFTPFTLASDQFIDPNKTPVALPATTKNPTPEEAIAHWQKTGFKTVTLEQYVARRAVCDKCEYFDGVGHMGAGLCKQCGCSGSKLYMKPSVCPVNKWGAVS